MIQHLHRLLARYHTGGLDAVDPKSRRPRSDPRATSPAIREEIIDLRLRLTKDGLDAGPVTIAWHLTQPVTGDDVVNQSSPPPTPMARQPPPWESPRRTAPGTPLEPQTVDRSREPSGDRRPEVSRKHQRVPFQAHLDQVGTCPGRRRRIHVAPL